MRRAPVPAQVRETRLILDPARMDACERCGARGVAEVSWRPVSQVFGLTTTCRDCLDEALATAVADSEGDGPIAIEWSTDAVAVNREVRSP